MAQMLSHLCMESPFDKSLGQLFEQPMLPDEIFGCVVIGQKGIEQVSG